MAFPPPVLPVDRTDALDQQINHPDDHNDTNGAVNTIAAELGANPSGQHADLTTRLQYEGTRSAITGGVDHWDTFGGFAMQSATAVVTTDTNGNAAVPFPHVFEAPPIVLVSNGDIVGAGWVYFGVYLNNVGAFTVQARSGIDGSLVINTTLRINWVAFGWRVS